MQNDGRNAGDKFISTHKLNTISLSWTTMNEILTAIPIFLAYIKLSALQMILFNISGSKKCKMADAKWVIYILVI